MTPSTLARSEASGTGGPVVSPRASAGTAAAVVAPPATAAAPLCRRCGRPIGLTTFGFWAHREHVGQPGHYVLVPRGWDGAA